MELFRLLGTIAIDNSGANVAIDDTTEKAEKSHGNISKAFEKIGGAAVAVGKTVAVGLGAASTAIGAIAKSALDGYADYEQLVGGVETLFKDSAKVVQEYADNAYKTAGLSANDYMETVTSFSASLLQGLNGDTAKAAEIANRAITDMSDNANKMGTDMSMIQNAYQGFAKQNYTMLDNLKLGYGGTQAEMARLINDSGVLGDAMEVNAETVKDVSFDKIIEAIGVVQDRMGITGTTAKEASETIAGSVASMKSAWTNLLSGLGNEDADLSGLMDKFVDSAITAGNNIIPRIKVILNGITKAIGKLMPKISEHLPSMMQDILPGLIEGAVALFNGLVSALPTLLQILIEQVPFIISQIGSALRKAVPKLFRVAKEIIGELFDFISLEMLNTGVSFDELLSGIFESDAFATLSATFESVKASFAPLIEAFANLGSVIAGSVDGASLFQTAFSLLADGISAVWTTVGQPVFDAITNGINWVAENWGTITATMSEAFSALWGECQSVWAAIGQPIWDMIMFVVDEVVGMFQQHMPEIQAFFEGAVAGISDTWENHLKPAFEAIGTFLNDVLKPTFEYVFKTVIEPLVEEVFGAIADLWENSLKPTFDGICDFLTGVFTADFDAAFQGLFDIVNSVFGGIQTIIETPFKAAKESVSKVIEDLKKLFNFEFTWPKIQLPHFGITPKGWQIGDLLKGSIPSLGIEWYAKGGVLTDPTIFGMNGNNAMIGGEKGAEAVAPIDVLQGYVSEAVASQNAGLIDVLYRILEAILAMDENMGGNLRDALDGTSLKVGEREFARLVNKSVSRTQANEVRVGGAYV